MNANIERLLDKATTDNVVNQELFARLLIEECAKVCEELRFTKEGPAEHTAYQRLLCSVSIKENFGLMSKGPITAINVK